MPDLTREQIERMRSEFGKYVSYAPLFNSLCDMALRSLPGCVAVEHPSGMMAIGKRRLNALETVLRLADELTCALDHEAEDIGGCRPSGVIVKELGPAVDKALAAAPRGKGE